MTTLTLSRSILRGRITSAADQNWWTAHLHTVARQRRNIYVWERFGATSSVADQTWYPPLVATPETYRHDIAWDAAGLYSIVCVADR